MRRETSPLKTVTKQRQVNTVTDSDRMCPVVGYEGYREVSARSFLAITSCKSSRNLIFSLDPLYKLYTRGSIIRTS
jgi:hypothetical protein